MGPFILPLIYWSCVSCVQVRERRYVRHTRFQTHGASDVLLSSPSPSGLTCLSTCSLTKSCKSSLYSKDSGQCQVLGRRLDTRGTQATHITDNKMRYYVKISCTYDDPKQLTSTASDLDKNGVQRIVFAKPSSYGRQEICLKTKSVSYRYRPRKRYVSMDYDSKHRRLIVATRDGVISIDRHTNKFKTVKNARATSLAVDSEQQLVFLTISNIYRMTTTGQKYRLIAKAETGRIFTYLSLQPKNRMIYALKHGWVYRMTYEGHDLELILKKHYAISVLAAHSNQETIFYNHYRSVQAYDIPSTDETTLRVPVKNICYLIYHDGKLYIATNRLIYIRDLATKHTEKLKKKKSLQLSMCLITG